MGSQHGDELRVNTMRDGWTEQYGEEEAQFSVSCSPPGEVVAGWGATPRTVVTISEKKGKGSVREPKESREERCNGC